MLRSLADLRLSVLQGPDESGRMPRGETNLRWLVHLRWTALVGQVATILVVRFGLGIDLPLAPLFAILLLQLGTNIVLLQRLGQANEDPGAAGPAGRHRSLVLGVTVLDLLALGALLALSGGIANPFCAFVVIHVALAAVLLPLRLALAAAAVAAVILIVIDFASAEVPELLSDRALRGWGTVVSVSLASFLTVLFVSRVSEAIVGRSEDLEAERERRERRRHLEALGNLAAGAAHELGTPLGTIAIVSKELTLRLERGGASPEAVADAELIRAEVARCRRILSRMSTDHGGGIGESLVATELAGLGERVVEELGSRERVQVRVDEGEGPPLELPVDGLATAIRALVQNGLDASAPCGEVTLTLERTDGVIRVVVADNGTGMTPEEVERALLPFYT
ncbi:MAG: ATP-binding protein, partial [Planctomycetota bacterium]